MNCNLFLSVKQIQPFLKINFNHLMEVLNVIWITNIKIGWKQKSHWYNTSCDMSRDIRILFSYPSGVDDTSRMMVLCDKHVPFCYIINTQLCWRYWIIVVSLSVVIIFPDSRLSYLSEDVGSYRNVEISSAFSHLPQKGKHWQYFR